MIKRLSVPVDTPPAVLVEEAELVELEREVHRLGVWKATAERLLNTMTIVRIYAAASEVLLMDEELENG